MLSVPLFLQFQPKNIVALGEDFPSSWEDGGKSLPLYISGLLTSLLGPARCYWYPTRHTCCHLEQQGTLAQCLISSPLMSHQVPLPHPPQLCQTPSPGSRMPRQLTLGCVIPTTAAKIWLLWSVSAPPWIPLISRDILGPQVLPTAPIGVRPDLVPLSLSLCPPTPPWYF